MRSPSIALFLAACAAHPVLEPALPDTEVPAAQGRAAAVEASGVEITATVGAWRGSPDELTAVLPILVTIDNAGEVPLRLRYDAFGLAAPDGEVYPALPPFDIEGTAIEPVAVAPWDYDGFRVAPHVARHYPHYLPWHGTFAYDPPWYRTGYTTFREIALPTGDMIQKALPEGVLEVGGRITGFLYFENPESDVERVVFTAALVDANTGAAFGTVRIPFAVSQSVSKRG